MEPFYLEQKQIQEFLPHRPPFLLVDRILSITGPEGMDDENPKSKVGIKVVGIKCVSMNEPFFVGHFPKTPVMPGVLILETMAQVASFSMYPRAVKNIQQMQAGYQCVLVGVDKARFRVPVIPGDYLRIECEVAACRTQLWNFSCKAFVDDKLVAEASLMANLVNSAQKQVF